MSFDVEIAGNSELGNYRTGSLNINRTLKGTNKCSLTLNRLPGANDQGLEIGQTVEVFDSTGTIVFGGTIDRLNVHKPHDRYKRVDVTALGHQLTLQRRVLRQNYSGVTAGAIAESIIDILSAENISKGTIDNGPEIPSMKFEFNTAAQSLNTLADTAGMAWYIDPSRTFHFFSNNTGDAPSPLGTLDQNSEVKPETLEVDRSQFRNRQYVRSNIKQEYKIEEERFLGGEESTSILRDTDEVGEPITERIEGNEDGLSFPTLSNEVVEVEEAYIIRTDSNGNVTYRSSELNVGFGNKHRVGAASFTMERAGAGIFDWYEENLDATVLPSETGGTSNRIHLSPDKRGLSENEFLEITYIPKTDSTVVKQSDHSIDEESSKGFGTGIHAAVEQKGQFDNIQAAESRAANMVSRFSDDAPVIDYVDYESGRKLAQRVTVDLDKFGIDNIEYVINEITVTDPERDDDKLEREIKLVTQSRFRGFADFHTVENAFDDQDRQEQIVIPPATDTDSIDSGSDESSDGGEFDNIEEDEDTNKRESDSTVSSSVLTDDQGRTAEIMSQDVDNNQLAFYIEDQDPPIFTVDTKTVEDDFNSRRGVSDGQATYFKSGGDLVTVISLNANTNDGDIADIYRVDLEESIRQGELVWTSIIRGEFTDDRGFYMKDSRSAFGSYEFPNENPPNEREFVRATTGSLADDESFFYKVEESQFSISNSGSTFDFDPDPFQFGNTLIQLGNRYDSNGNFLGTFAGEIAYGANDNNFILTRQDAGIPEINEQATGFAYNDRYHISFGSSPMHVYDRLFNKVGELDYPQQSPNERFIRRFN